MVAVEGERMLRLAEQCLERAKSFIGKNADPPDLSASASASSCWSPGQSQPHQTTVLPPAVATNTGKYFTSSQKLFYKLLYITIKLESAPGVTHQTQPMYGHVILCFKPITTLCLSVSPPLSQSLPLTLLLTQGVKQPVRQRPVTAGCCQMVAGSSPLSCLLKSSRDCKQWSHRTEAKSKGPVFIKESKYCYIQSYVV